LHHKNYIAEQCNSYGVTDNSVNKLVNLEELSCERCENITDRSIEQLPNLKNLYCDECPGITDEMKELVRNRE
jgi:transcription elongation factor Elf1